ncbi:MAG: hypothetical protein HOE53_02770 [Candidatus Magasanikbacteria bacterium]|jgi:hypothetical protein|nr:hypothetical protein [Candidatus Magasanikbacteria bacterium]
MKVKITCGQWVFEFAVVGDSKTTMTYEADSYNFFNPGKDGQNLFYQLKNGAYGAPIIDAEPTLRLVCPEGVTYYNGQGESAMPAEAIAGFICVKDGKVVHRAGLTHWIVFQKKEFTVDESGNFVVDGEVWALSHLLQKDQNRIIGYDAVLVPVGSLTDMSVEILELADIAARLVTFTG